MTEFRDLSARPAVNPDDDAREDAQRGHYERLLAPGDPNARMDAYYYGFEATGIGIIDAILSAVATAGKAYHGTDMWAEEDEWTKPSHEARIQAAADAAAAELRAALAPEADQ